MIRARHVRNALVAALSILALGSLQACSENPVAPFTQADAVQVNETANGDGEGEDEPECVLIGGKWHCYGGEG